MSSPENKIMTAQEAVSRFIKPGSHVAFGGFTVLRRPMGIAREVARQRRGDLYLSMNGGSIIEEMLAGCGLVKWLETTYIGMEANMPVAHALRHSIEEHVIELVEDYSNWSYAQRCLAGRLGMPFMPCLSNLGSDLLRYDSFGDAGLRGIDEEGKPFHSGIPPQKFAVIDDPFEGYGLRPAYYDCGDDTVGNKSNAYRRRGLQSTKYTGQKGVKVMLVPPLLPEVSVIHAQRVSVDGIVRIEGLVGPDLDQGLCGRTLIVECERICPSEELREVPEHNQIAPHFVHAVVEQPYGAYPTSVPNYYDYDYDWFKNYAKAMKNKPLEEVRAWWFDHIDSDDDWEYLQRRVGWEKLAVLRSKPEYHFNPDIDRFGKE
jgi:glutaconate CoA-transferase subunit A